MFSLILMLIFCLALAIFAVQNTAPIQLHFLWWTSQTLSLAIVVVMSTALGMFLTLLVSIPTLHRRRRALKQKERELSDLRDAVGKH
jgi:putative membrane protein